MPSGSFCAQPGDASAFLDQVGGFRTHVQIEGFVALAALGQKIEKIPLRHQRHEFAVRRQVGEIGHRHPLVANLRAEPFDFLVRHFEERFEQAELVNQFQRRGMHGVAAEVAEKISVFFQHHDVDAGPRQQKAEHHAGRPAAGDATGRGDRCNRHEKYVYTLMPCGKGPEGSI